MKNIRTVFTGLFLMLAFVGAASAAVTYSVDVSQFETSIGETLTTCDNITGWTKAGTNSTIENETEYFIHGNGSIKLNAYNGVKSSVVTAINHNFSTADNIVVTVYIPNVSTVNKIFVQFSSVTDDTKYMQEYIRPTGAGGIWFRQGWNTFVIDKSRFASAGTPGDSWENTMLRCRVGVTPKAGMNTSIIIDRIGYDYRGTPTVLMVFDDGLPSVYDYAYPVMKERGLVGTSFIIPARVAAATAHMPLNELKELQAAGWSISSHGMTHNTALTSLSAEALKAELGDSHNYLIENGFGRGAYAIAYRGGAYNQAVLDVVDDYYVIGRSSLFSFYEPHIQSSNGQGEADALTIKSIYDIGTPTNVALYNNSVDSCIAQNGMLVMMFHGFTTEPEEQTEYVMSVDNFTKICDYVAAKQDAGEIRVIPVSTLIRTNVPNSTPVLNKTVQISADGTTEMMTDNTYPDEIVDMQVTPSVGTVNVTVLEWSDTLKRWVESSEIHDATTSHIIGGFSANTKVQIKRDGVNYGIIESNETGFIHWTYDGGFSEHEFEAFVVDTTEGMSTNISSGIWQSSLGMILVAVVVFFGTMLYQGIKKGKLESDTIILAAKGLLFIAMTLMVGAIILSAF